jgi:hypothetical protein
VRLGRVDAGRNRRASVQSGQEALDRRDGDDRIDESAAGLTQFGGLDHPVGVEERVHETPPRSVVTKVLRATGEVEFVAVVRASEHRDKLPRKTRLRTCNGKPAYL